MIDWAHTYIYIYIKVDRAHYNVEYNTVLPAKSLELMESWSQM